MVTKFSTSAGTLCTVPSLFPGGRDDLEDSLGLHLTMPRHRWQAMNITYGVGMSTKYVDVLSHSRRIIVQHEADQRK